MKALLHLTAEETQPRSLETHSHCFTALNYFVFGTRSTNQRIPRHFYHYIPCTTSEMSAPKTIAFFGATIGCGLATLSNALDADTRCIALCRTPSKLQGLFSDDKTSRLTIVEGNVHDVDAVKKCLTVDGTHLVDTIIFSIGSRSMNYKLELDDPSICRRAIATVLEALNQLRRQGLTGRPRLIALSTTGISQFGPDTPYIVGLLYYYLLYSPHEDKKAMEQLITGSDEDFTIVRSSWMLDGATNKAIRVGVEDPKHGRESDAIGYSITREDVGKWIFENLVQNDNGLYVRKIATITH
ncbi:hypothetical protein J3E69DRAFT_349623 [Trichoderma sp. SZMC 28015]